MSPTASTIPAARTWLVAALEAETANDLGGVKIIRTGVWDEIPDRERIEVRNARNIDREWRGAFGSPLTENYTVPVFIESYQQGGRLEDVEARMWDLVSIVERIALSDSSWGGTVNAVLPAGAPDGEESGAGSQSDFTARITLEFQCTAYVRLG